jgi:hypothetical protein
LSNLLKRLLIYLPVSVLLTVLLSMLIAFLGGKYHSTTPAAILFPYTTLALHYPTWDALPSVFMALQFQIYAILLAVSNRSQRGPILTVIVAVHLAAVLITLMV